MMETVNPHKEGERDLGETPKETAVDSTQLMRSNKKYKSIILMVVFTLILTSGLSLVGWVIYGEMKPQGSNARPNRTSNPRGRSAIGNSQIPPDPAILSLAVDDRGIPVIYSDALVRVMGMQIPFNKTEANPTGQPTVVGEVNPNTGDYVVTCPYCGKPAEVNQQQMNCHIFRCGPAGPHDSFAQVYARRQHRSWKDGYCGGPYQVVKHRHSKQGEYGVAKQCSYNK